MDSGPLEASGAALRQAQDQSELLLRSLQQNLSFDSLDDPKDVNASGDWSHAEEKHWHNVPPVMKRAVATLGRLMTRQTNLLLETVASADRTHLRVGRIEETMKVVQKSVEALTFHHSERTVYQDRTEAARAALESRCDQDFDRVRQSLNLCADKIRQLETQSTTVDHLEKNVDSVQLTVSELLKEELPSVRLQLDQVRSYETSLKAVLGSVKDLQEQQVRNRYSSAMIPSSAGFGTSRGRSAGRWLWEGQRLLNSRSRLIQWDIRSNEQGESIKWSSDDKRYVIDLSRGGLYNISFGAATTSPNLKTDALLLYIDDDAVLSDVQTTSFATSKGKSTHRTVKGLGDQNAACYTTINSVSKVFLPSRAFICVRCTVAPEEIVCAWIEVEDYV